MVTELQFVAIAAFLLWCLVSSLSGLLALDPDQARLVWREHGPDGWGGWREAYFALSPADHRRLVRPDPVLDPMARATLLDAVMEQTRHPSTDVIQFAVVRMSSEADQPTLVFLSDQMPVTPAIPSADTWLDAQAR